MKSMTYCAVVRELELRFERIKVAAVFAPPFLGG